MKLYLRSSTIKRITEYGSYVFYFTAAGVDVVDPLTRTVVAYADVANTVTGAANANGVYIGTLANGVYFISHANVASGGNRTADVVLKFSTATTPALPTSNAINDMDATGSELILATGYGVCYFHAPTAFYKCAVTGGSKKVALAGGHIVWENAAVAYTIETPLADWGNGRAIADGTVPSGDPPTAPSRTNVTGMYGDDYTCGTNSRAFINGQHFFFSGGRGPNCVRLNSVTRAPTKVPFSPAQALGSAASGSTYQYQGVAACDAGYCAVSCNTGSNAVALYKYDSNAVQWNQISFTMGATLSTVGSLIWVGDYLVIFGYSATYTSYVLQLYSRSGDNMTFLGTKITGLTWSATTSQGTPLNPMASTNLIVYHGGAATVAKILRIASDDIVQTSTFGTSGKGIYNQVSEIMGISELSNTNHFAITFTWNDGSYSRRCFNVMKLNPVTGVATCVAIPSDYQIGGGGYGEYNWTGQASGRRCGMHPSGRFIIETGTYASNLNITVRYFDPVAQTLTGQGYITALQYAVNGNSNWVRFIDSDYVISAPYVSTTNSEFDVMKFNYGTKPAGVTGITAINDIAGGSDGCAFVATNAGILCYDSLKDQYIGLKDIFGISNNVVAVNVTPEAKPGIGALAYGTSTGANTGQMGVISLRSNMTLITHAGDQGPVWCAGLESVAYLDNMDRVEDAVSSTRKLVMLGLSVKSIVKHNGYIYHFTEAGLDVHRIADGVRTCWALVSNTVCGTVNDNGVFFGTTAGVKKLTHANIDSGVEQTANVTVVYSTTTNPAIQSNTITDLAGFGTALAVATSAGVDFLPDAATMYHRTAAGGGKAVAVDGTRFAWSENNTAYFMPHPAADWTAGSATQVPAVPGTVINAQRFGADLFVATDAGIVILDTGASQTKVITTELGEVRNVVAIHPTSTASRAQGLLAYGLSYIDGTGKFGVLDMSTLA